MENEPKDRPTSSERKVAKVKPEVDWAEIMLEEYNSRLLNEIARDEHQRVRKDEQADIRQRRKLSR